LTISIVTTLLETGKT